MRLGSILIFSAMMLLGWPGLGQARVIPCYLPEELEPKADFICTASVTSIEPSDDPGRMLAHLKVLHVFKGDLPASIEFIYVPRSPTEELVPNLGWMHADLHKDKRYRFFLKVTDGVYRFKGVLDGECDDDYSDVEVLSSAEKDDGKYLTGAEATKIAQDYLAAKRPGVKFMSSFSDFQPRNDDGMFWSVYFHRTPNQHSSYAVICVRGDGTVDAQRTNLRHPPD
jgi:hypothetical protein